MMMAITCMHPHTSIFHNDKDMRMAKVKDINDELKDIAVKSVIAAEERPELNNSK